MFNFIDSFIDNITMYRLVLYYLIAIFVSAVIFSFLKILPYSGFSLIFSALFLIACGWVTNKVFAKTFKAQTNIESVYISALILALIITPIRSLHDLSFLFWAAVWTMASKFIFAKNRKHIFNPVAFAVFLTSFTINQSASWWIGGSLIMLPIVLIGGILIVRKIRRWDLVQSFLVTSILTVLGFSILKGGDLISAFARTITLSPLLFFAFIMLTEPLTTPPTKKLRLIYAAIVGILFAPQFHIGSFYTTPEIALLIGNVFSYIVSPKAKILLKLKEKIQIAPDVYDFVFSSSNRLAFLPGQYMEWTLSHHATDSRGNRRYFTLASSPTENDVRVGIKFPAGISSYKKTLLSMQPNQEIIAGQLAGDFTLPKDPNRKLVFIAGGIGITPFRSMIEYLLNKNEKREIVLFYSNKNAEDVVYTDVFSQASQQLGIKTVYTVTDTQNIPQNWQGRVGRVDANMIQQEVPDFMERLFYLSGPHTMVAGFEEVLKGMGVKKEKIITDYFPGF